MRIFDYTNYPATLLTPEITGLLSSIHEFRGKQDLYIAAKKDVLKTLLGALSKSQIAAECPDISIAMIEKTLKELLDTGFIVKRGGGRSTSYYRT